MEISKEELLYRIEIPDFKEHVELSKSRRAKYYYKNKGVDKLPKKYQGKEYVFDKSGILIHKLTKEKIISNPKSEGTPKLWKISGNEIFSYSIHYQNRNKATSWAHQYLRSFIKLIDKIVLEKNEYLRLHLEIYDIAGKANWDVDNKWPWHKWFQDTLVECKKIPDDTMMETEN